MPILKPNIVTKDHFNKKHYTFCMENLESDLIEFNRLKREFNSICKIIGKEEYDFKELSHYSGKIKYFSEFCLRRSFRLGKKATLYFEENNLLNQLLATRKEIANRFFMVRGCSFVWFTNVIPYMNMGYLPDWFDFYRVCDVSDNFSNLALSNLVSIRSILKIDFEKYNRVGLMSYLDPLLKDYFHFGRSNMSQNEFNEKMRSYKIIYKTEANIEQFFENAFNYFESESNSYSLKMPISHLTTLITQNFLKGSENNWREKNGWHRRELGNWKTQRDIYYFIAKEFSKFKFEIEASPKYLGKQRFDLYCKELKLGIEYQGEQHFRPIEYFGGQVAFEKGIARDKSKIEKTKSAGEHLLFIYPSFDFNNLRAELESLIDQIAVRKTSKEKSKIKIVK